jgi:hypothetical protein
MAKSTVAFHPPADVSNSSQCSPCWHDEFIQMLPKIERHAQIAFRGRQGDRRDEAIQEVVCHACQAYARLVEEGRTDAATWSSLAKYAVARVRDGRRVGVSRNVDDVSSEYCQNRRRVQLRNLFEWDTEEEEWREIVVEDRKATPADIAATRIDFAAWLDGLSRRKRQIALALAGGESTSTVAGMFRVSAGRISQIRRELMEAWEQFHGSIDPEAETAAA